ncbi:PDF receptor-like isoform X1 [Haliotis cracherodii]|uniref:PDF receptor-like isoform X1 n=2 Tax=Haliotis cracherodii TaxID=6455 RepID=UPI0039E8C1EA
MAMTTMSFLMENFTEACNSSLGDSLMWPQRGIQSQEECLAKLGDAAFPNDGGLYCNGTWDKVLCWKAAKAGTAVRMNCPPLPGLVPTNFATRKCGPNGRWEGKIPGDYSVPQGYTNYIDCYTQQALEIYKRFYMNKTPQQKQVLRDIVSSARTMEIIGLCLSLVVTIVSLIIFSYFRNLKCHRTRIHKNLFVAIIVQISIMLILYIDQYIARTAGGEVAGAASGSSGAIYDTPVFCEILYAILEYTKTVKFMWMFVEGLYLHNMIAVSVFSGKPNYAVFYAIGWGFPVLLIVAWVVAMTQMYVAKCWYAYYYLKIIWIIEAPRVAVIAVNLLFLLNIIRVLVMKLRQSHTNEANKVRKAVKAAIVLLPLLGITNFVVMIEPSHDNIIKFGVWAFSAHFLISFEGFFISLLYCFLNGEVQITLQRQLCRRYPTSASLDYSTVTWRNGSNKKQNLTAASMTVNGHVQPLLRDPFAKRAGAAALGIRRALFKDNTGSNKSIRQTSNLGGVNTEEINEQRI